MRDLFRILIFITAVALAIEETPKWLWLLALLLFV